MAVIARTAGSLTTVRSEATSAGNGAPPPENRKTPAAAAARPLLSISKPSLVVRTESNVRKEVITKPDPPCVVCRGSGRVDCYDCNGRGRTNHIQSSILPKGEWPKWCRRCGGSGLGYCDRCLGTGEYRYIMGFHFMKKDTDQIPGKRRFQDGNRPSSGSFTDMLLNGDQSDSAQ